MIVTPGRDFGQYLRTVHVAKFRPREFEAQNVGAKTSLVDRPCRADVGGPHHRGGLAAETGAPGSTGRRANLARHRQAGRSQRSVPGVDGWLPGLPTQQRRSIVLERRHRLRAESGRMHAALSDWIEGLASKIGAKSLSWDS